MEYLVSAVIPVYNREKYVERAVESVLAQKNSEEIQIILVDDGSTDSSPAICDGLSKKYGNVFSVHQKNSGVSAARNTGIEIAEGKWLSFIDSDDYLLDGFYSELICEPYVDLLCCDFDISDSVDFALLSEYIKSGVYTKKDFKDVLYPLMAEPTVFYSACNKIFRTDIVKKNNVRFPVGKKYGEDMTFVYEYVKFIDSFKYVNRRLYGYFIYGNNTTSVVAESYEVYKDIFLHHCEYFKDFDEDKSLFGKLQLNFLMRSVSAIHTAVSNMKFFEAVRYVRKIVNDDVLSENYKIKPVCRYDDGFYKLLDKRILKKQALLICILIRLFDLRVKLISKK